MTEFHFIRPAWLLTLIPYLILLWLLLKSKLAQDNWSRICDPELVPFIIQEKAVNRSHWPLTTAAFAILLTIVAIAGPTWQRLPSPVFRNISALVIILDLSRSMDAEDIKPSRLSRARFKITDILAQRKDGQTALVVYAGEAFTVTPLTDDNETINSQLSSLSTSLMPSQGSNTKQALQKAMALLQQSGLNKGDLLLVSDSIDLDQVEDEINDLGAYRLSVLAVGTVEGVPIKLARGDFLKTDTGEIVIPKLEIAQLRQVARAGGGYFQRLSTDSSDTDKLQAFFDQNLASEDQKNNGLLLDQWQEQGPWLLLLALPLAAFSFRKGILCIILMLVLPIPKNSYAFDWQDLWQTGNQQGQQQLELNQFEQAAEQFDNPQWRAVAQYKAGQYQQALESLAQDESADGWYNKGNILARLGKFKQALTAYDKSLAIDTNNTDANHNKELVEKALEKQQQQEQQQSGDDSDENNSEDSDSGSSDQQSSDSTQDNPEQNQQEKFESSDSKQEDNESKNAEQDSEPDQQAETQQQDQDEQAESKSPEQEQAKATPINTTDETKLANEQWLKRIPDDPAGLLRRKFKYQYGQKQNRSDSKNKW